MRHLALAFVATTLCLPALLQAEPATGQSLSKTRLEIIKGESPGVVILGARPAASAASAAAAAAPAGGKAAPAKAAPAAEQVSIAENIRRLFKNAPPSGQPMNAAKRLDSSTQGIALPTAADAAKPADK